MERLDPQIAGLLERESGLQVHFSDVFRELATPEEDAYWRKIDYDSELTVLTRSVGFASHLEKIPIGLFPWIAEAGLVTFDDLVQERNEKAELNYERPTNHHKDVLREISEYQELAPIALANCAPRSKEHTANGSNGTDFYLAVTHTGLEVYTTPLHFLEGLDSRDRIRALYRIPTVGNPEFDGEKQQFRSARVERDRQHPHFLEPVFQYRNRDEVVRAKIDGSYPQIIPEDTRPGHIAFVDKFGNIRLDLKNARDLATRDIGSLVTYEITYQPIHGQRVEQEIVARVAADMPEASRNSHGKFNTYINVSDGDNKYASSHLAGPNNGVGYAELIIPVDDPNRSRETAAFALYGLINNLDIDRTQVRLAS